MNINKQIPLNVNFELGSTMKSIKDLLNISKGTTYRLENSKKDTVTIRVEKVKIGEGKIYIKSGKMYVEITNQEKEEV